MCDFMLHVRADCHVVGRLSLGQEGAWSVLALAFKFFDLGKCFLALLDCQVMELVKVIVDFRVARLIVAILAVIQDLMRLQQNLHVRELLVKIEDNFILFCNVVHQLSQSFDLIFLLLDSALLLYFELVF